MATILFADRARRRLGSGVDALANAVRVTLGPRGRTVALAGYSGTPAITGDGVTVAREVQLADPHANLGARLVRAAAATTGTLAGDGATTTAVLAQEMVRRGLRAVAAGAAPVAVQRGMDAAVETVLTRLLESARPVRERSEFAAVAALATRDVRLGELIADAFDKVRTDGLITVEESPAFGHELEFTEGMRFDTGYLSPYMATDGERGEAVLDDAYVLVYDGKITGVADILPLLEKVVRASGQLLVVADDVGQEALSMLVANTMRGRFTCVAVEAPSLGSQRRAKLADMAALTGARVIAPELGRDLEGVGSEVLGRARRIVVTRRDLTIVDGGGDVADVQARVAHLGRELAAAGSEWERARLRERLANLAGGACAIRVGTAAEADAAARKKRVEDGIAATRAAIEEGVVVGGGVALARAASALDDGGLADDERAGLEVIRGALTAPLRRIAENAGADGNVVAARVAESPEPAGYDAVTGEYGNTQTRVVLDPVTVTRAALRHAASVAGMLLTAGALVVNGRRSPPAGRLDVTSQHQHGHGRGHG